MTRTARLAGLSLVLFPATMAVADQLYLQVSPPDDAGTLSGYGLEEAMADLAAVEAHRGLYELVSYLFLLGALLTIPMTLVMWRLAVGGARRWAWAGAVLGTCSVVGQFVHLFSSFAVYQVFSEVEDRRAVAQILLDWESNTFSMVVFAPYLAGVLLAAPVQAIALKRAGIIPWWALVSVLGGSALFAVLGSFSVVSLVWGAALVVGLAPAAAAWLRTGPAAGTTAVTSRRVAVG